MQIDSSDKKGYRIFKFRENINVTSDLGELRHLVDEALREDVKNVALCFGERTFLYTAHISVIIQCLSAVRDAGGNLAFINPNDNIIEALRAIGLTGMTMMYTSEDELG